MGIALRARGLGKSYGRPGAPVQKVLSELSFEIGEGEWVVIMGDSGSGKSTLLNVLAGIDPFDSGELFLDDLSWGPQNDEAKTLIRRREMGFVFQNYNLFPFLSAFDNVALPARLNGKNDRESVLSLLREVGLEGKAHKFPSELSGGEQQRVAIARALVHRPRLLLADEPTGALDHLTGERVLDLMKLLHKEFRPTIVMSTHSIEAARWGDRILHLRDGRFVSSAS
uniref:ABC transporter, ATP-binding protein n=1 Tax=Leptospirillum ferrodiazotrophum TaxID=412449 RepID=C6I0M7_9BACT|nr:MAG: ABC transporter, ATP-binding protein [Leptospirillum ferrodiazotrophum]